MNMSDESERRSEHRPLRLLLSAARRVGIVPVAVAFADLTVASMDQHFAKLAFGGFNGCIDCGILGPWIEESGAVTSRREEPDFTRRHK